MSKGAYTILQRMNGREDAMLTATKYLNDRLNDIYMENQKMGRPDPCPNISDVLKTHMMYMVSDYRPHVSVVHEYFKVGKEGGSVTTLYTNSGNANKLRFCLKGNNGDFLHDMVVHLKFQDLGDPSADNTAVHFHYCDYPGVRLFKRVVFRIDNVDIDDYLSHDTILAQRLDISRDKINSWYTNIGQAPTYNGSYYNSDYQITEVMRFRDGAQTLKTFQPGLELWIPLRFWFNLDVGQSLYNSLIRTDDKYIEVELEDLNKIIAAYDGNLNPIHNYFSNKHVKINTVELYSRNIYINPELHDIMSKKRIISIVRVNRRHIEQLTKAQGHILFSQLKYPIEHISFGFRPLSNDLSFTNWARFGNIQTTSVPIVVPIINTLLPPGVFQIVTRTATYDKVTPVVEQLGLVVYGNVVYPNINEGFYNSYIGYVSPDAYLNREPGVYMINLSHYRNKYTVTGYINNSEAREVYLGYSGVGISVATPVIFHAVARCINFLIYSGGSIKLKYIT
jgi:hypothetical protein